LYQAPLASKVFRKYNTPNETAIFPNITRDFNTTTLGYWIDSDSWVHIELDSIPSEGIQLTTRLRACVCMYVCANMCMRAYQPFAHQDQRASGVSEANALSIPRSLVS